MRRRRRSESDDEARPAKRSHLELSYADEEDEDTIEPAPPRAKRLRRNVDAPVRQEEDEGFEEVEDEITPVYSRGTRSRSRRSGAAVVPSDDEGEQPYADDDEEEDEEDIKEQIRFSSEKGFSHSGILQSVRLDRFMSHGCFQYDLGPNLNIISGKNGSGKSAIVAALQIGLNGTVGMTERARKLDELITHGEDSAIITIKILNRKPPVTENGITEPDLTYQHHVYGDVITIERRIGRDNRGNSFAVKARNRHVKLPEGTTPKQEVQNICDHFGFMVDNPVAILTQTKSKEFLAKGKPEDHYRLFRRATLLGPLQDELARTKTITKEVENTLKWNLERAPKAEEKLRKKELAHQQAQEMKNIHQIIRQAEALFAWTLVQEEELKLNMYEKKTAEEFEPAAERARVAFEKSQEKIEELKTEQGKHSKEVTDATERSRLLATALRSAKKNAQTAKFDMERQQRRIQEFEAECKRHHRDIQNAQERMKVARDRHFAGQAQKKSIVDEIRQLESSIQERQERVTSARNRESTLLAEKLPLEDEMQRLSRESDALKYDYEGKRRQHMQASSVARSKDSLGRFGDDMSGICDRIKRNERKFHTLPIGPIGQFVKIHDNSWAAAVETAIGFNKLRGFIVNDSYDAKVLEELFPRGGNRPAITIANMDRDRYAVGRQDIPDVSSDGHRTILETVAIRHDAVYNLLIDQSEIERQVLGNEEDVTRLGWSRIPNLKMAWNRRCDRAYSKNGSNVFRNGYRPSARILTSDMRPYLESLERDLSSLSQEMDKHAGRVRESEAKLHNLNMMVQNEKREIDECGREVVDFSRKKGKLEDQLNQAENAFDPSPFEQEISGYENLVNENEANRSRALSEVTTLEETCERASEQAEAASSEMREANVVTEKASRLLEAVHSQIARVKSRDRQLRKTYGDASHKVTKAHEEMAQQRNRIAEVMIEARKTEDSCPSEVNPKAKSSAAWQRYLTTQKQRLETEQERRGGRTAAEIEMDYLRSKKIHDENVQYQKRVRYYVKMLKRGTSYREELLIRLNKSLKKMVKANFRRFLSTRGHSGTIIFGKSQNGTPTLRLCAEMATHRKVDGERHRTEDLRTLSGGEKSYTTLCFILALAEICQTPVRVMDEIDVFQDEASRYASFTTITTFCTQYLSNRQIIIITPLALPNFPTNESVRVVRLPDPVRQDGRGRQTLIDNYMTPAHEE